jgi:DUF4097 and DUF4098 domain-containing protein YvlB
MRRLIVLLTLAGLAAPAGSAAQVYPERIRSVERVRSERTHVERYQGRSREEQTERFTRTLRIGANGEVDLGNIAGDIVVTRGSGNDATLEVVKTSRGRTVQDAQEMLKLVNVDVTERGTRAEVRTRYPQEEDRRNNRRNFNVSVAYNVAVPERTRVTATSISGSISARDVKGDLALETVSGDVRVANAGRIPKAKTISGNVEIVDTNIEGAMDASTISGTLLLRKVQARRLDLGSVSGNVSIQDVACERVQAQSISGEVILAGQLARNGRYNLTSHSGEVRVLVSGDTGFEVEASSFSGSIRTDVPLNVQGNDASRGRRQRSIRGTYGDASAFLDLTTFSGSIVIGKR